MKLVQVEVPTLDYLNHLKSRREVHNVQSISRPRVCPAFTHTASVRGHTPVIARAGALFTPFPSPLVAPVTPGAVGSDHTLLHACSQTNLLSQRGVVVM